MSIFYKTYEQIKIAIEAKMVIACNTCCNMNKTHFAHTVNLYYISSGFWEQSF